VPVHDLALSVIEDLEVDLEGIGVIVRQEIVSARCQGDGDQLRR
jgi:hypothetical protein